MKKTILMILGLLAMGNTFIYTDAKAAPESPNEQSTEPCDPKTFTSICSADKLLICVNEMVKVIDCSENGKKEKTCAEFVDSKIARCISKEDRCIKEGEIIIKPKETGSGKKTNKRYKCQKTTQGVLYYHEMKNTKESTPKSTNSGELDNTNNDTIEDRLKCSRMNDVAIRQATLASGKSSTEYYRCEQNLNGRLIFRKLTEAEATEFVNRHMRTFRKHHDNENLSYRVSDNTNDLPNNKAQPENSKCRRSTFNNYCKDDYLFKCEDNQVIKENCKNNKKYNKCMETADLKDAQCISKDDICSSVGNMLTRSEKNKSKQLVISLKCQEASNGKMYFFYQDSRPRDSQIDLPF